MSGHILLCRRDSVNYGTIGGCNYPSWCSIYNAIKVQRYSNTKRNESTDLRESRIREAFETGTRRVREAFARGKSNVLDSNTDYAGQYDINTGEHEDSRIDGGYPRIRNTISGDNPETVTDEVAMNSTVVVEKAIELRKTLEQIRADKLQKLVRERNRLLND